ncbi:hypothetical protein LTR85_010514 [Meristemomyces frigidus]|nr:hypothetical protein LTR85_010514 [Meristemomyces frigidus]
MDDLIAAFAAADTSPDVSYVPTLSAVCMTVPTVVDTRKGETRNMELSHACGGDRAPMEGCTPGRAEQEFRWLEAPLGRRGSVPASQNTAPLNELGRNGAAPWSEKEHATAANDDDDGDDWSAWIDGNDDDDATFAEDQDTSAAPLDPQAKAGVDSVIYDYTDGSREATEGSKVLSSGSSPMMDSSCVRPAAAEILESGESGPLYLNPWYEAKEISRAHTAERERGSSDATVRASDKSTHPEEAATALSHGGCEEAAYSPWSEGPEMHNARSAAEDDIGLRERLQRARSRTPTDPWRVDPSAVEARAEREVESQEGQDDDEPEVNPWRDTFEPASTVLKHTDTTLTGLEQDDHVTMCTNSMNSLLYAKALSPDVARRELISQAHVQHDAAHGRFNTSTKRGSGFRLRAGDGMAVRSTDAGEGEARHHWWQRRPSKRKNDKGRLE